MINNEITKGLKEVMYRKYNRGYLKGKVAYEIAIYRRVKVGNDMLQDGLKMEADTQITF